MISIDVLLRFANKCEWFDPYFIEAKPTGIGFHAPKKNANYIIACFAGFNCTVSVSESFEPNFYFYVIQ